MAIEGQDSRLFAKGQRISFLQQIQQVMNTFQQFILSMGEDEGYELISNSVFYISIGTNDYIHYYLRNVSSMQSLYLPWSFNQYLAHIMKLEIKVLAGSISGCDKLISVVRNLHHILGGALNPASNLILLAVISM
ncbi:unnamed protein product [Fraxinus pennsylvanica]|uniref:GDSL esterase/lipase n=1 Tax=Fraxinus pennsylvanica TaxID=56036 RepID=A0AAD2AJR1_9LAMI|nr:unnamed protein product [Fraxinus pennsylvanica]